MFKIFLNIKNKLWKLWINIKYGENFLNDYHNLTKNTIILENLERSNKIENKESNECIDCKFFVPGNYFSTECMICDNGSKFIKKECKTFQI